MKIIFLPVAKDEFLEAIAYYEDALNGLGQRFNEEADRCVLRIAEHLNFINCAPGDTAESTSGFFPFIFHSSPVVRHSGFWQ